MKNKRLDIFQGVMMFMAVASLILCFIAEIYGHDYRFILLIGFMNLVNINISESFRNE